MGMLGGVLLGVAVGVLSGLVGIGGGVLLIPALVLFYRMSQHKAQGTSLAILLLPIGALAFWKYWQAGNVDLKLAGMVAAGFLVGGWVGGSWASHLSELALRRGFAVMLMVVAVRMLWN